MTKRFLKLSLLPLLVFFFCGSLFAEESSTVEPEFVVGSVLGEPVTAADIGLTAPIDVSLKFDARDREVWELMSRIGRTFGKPVVDRFCKIREIVVTPQEIVAYQWAAQKQRKKRLAESEAQRELVQAKLASSDLTADERRKLEAEAKTLEGLMSHLYDPANWQEPPELARAVFFARKCERELHKTYGGRVIFQQAGPEALDARRQLFEEAEQQGDLVFHDSGVRHLFYYYYKDLQHVFVDESTLEIASVADTSATQRPAVPRPPSPRRTHAPNPEPEKVWVYSSVTAELPELAPRQIVPVDNGIWFGGKHAGNKPAPLGIVNLQSGEITLLLENSSGQWDAVGNEAIAVQLDRKGLTQLRADSQRVSTWEDRPEGCEYFSQVLAFHNRFCISSPYQPLWVFDPWLRDWQKIELKRVNDQDAERLGASYYRPSMQRFVIAPNGELWGFQGTHDALRGNAVCRYFPENGHWQHFDFPWQMARGDDHWVIGTTDDAVMFAGPRDLLLFDKATHEWSTAKDTWPERAYDSAVFTPHGIFLLQGNTVQRLSSDLESWQVVATLDTEEPITAVAASGDRLFLATAAGIHLLRKSEDTQFENTAFYPWKLAEHACVYRAELERAFPKDGLPIAQGEWSEPINGLQARLELVEKPRLHGVRWLVPYLELKNVRDLAGPLEVDCDTPNLRIELVDNQGKLIDRGHLFSRSGPVVQPGRLVLPMDSSIRFSLECRNWGVGRAAAMVATDSGAWTFEAEDKGKIFLRAILTGAPGVPEWKTWHGELQTPPIAVDWH